MQGLDCALKRLHRGTRVIRGQIEDRQISCELCAPVIKMLREYAVAEIVALPPGEIRILNGQLGQGRSFPAGVCRIEFREFRQKNLINRDAVEDQMMQGDVDAV